MDIGNEFNKLQQIKYNLFKAQDPQTGRYDVMFEVQGNILYAHKTMLNLVSDTFDSMLSNRWAKKDVPIKIESCSYDNFYQFLVFLYTAQCQLTEENIFAMVDIAEFYGVDLFKKYCDKYLAALKVTPENIFKLLDMADKYSMIQLKISVYEYILHHFESFVNCDEYLKVSKQVVEDLVDAVKGKAKPEDLFQAVYKWVETQALNKQAADPNINLNDAIKSEITSLLQFIHFDKMEMHFLLESVVPRGFIFPSLSDLSEILCHRNLKTKVRITNSNGEILQGNLTPEKSVIEHLKSLSLALRTGLSDGQRCCYWPIYIDHPSAPSPIKVKQGIKWYLVLDEFQILRVMRGKAYLGNCYILALLKAEEEQGWVGTHNTILEIYQDS